MRPSSTSPKAPGPCARRPEMPSCSWLTLTLGSPADPCSPILARLPCPLQLTQVMADLFLLFGGRACPRGPLARLGHTDTCCPWPFSRPTLPHQPLEGGRRGGTKRGSHRKAQPRDGLQASVVGGKLGAPRSLYGGGILDLFWLQGEENVPRLGLGSLKLLDPQPLFSYLTPS